MYIMDLLYFDTKIDKSVIFQDKHSLGENLNTVNFQLSRYVYNIIDLSIKFSF